MGGVRASATVAAGSSSFFGGGFSVGGGVPFGNVGGGGGRVFTGGVTGFTITLFPFATLFAFVLALSLGGIGRVLALVLGFAAVIAAAEVLHEGDPTLFTMGQAEHLGFVLFSPAGVSRWVVAWASRTASEADAFASAPVAQAKGAATNAKDV